MNGANETFFKNLKIQTKIIIINVIIIIIAVVGLSQSVIIKQMNSHISFVKKYTI